MLLVHLLYSLFQSKKKREKTPFVKSVGKEEIEKRIPDDVRREGED